MKVAPEVRAKDVKDYKVVGTSQKRIDLPAKLTGEFTYANDVRIPGMLHGRVVRPPTITSKPANIDESSVKNIPGLVKIVQEGSFVGVVCQTEWAAIQAPRKRSKYRGRSRRPKCRPARTRYLLTSKTPRASTIR